MRGTVTIAIPLDATAGQLRALASLLGAVEAARWSSLLASFDKLDRDNAQLPESLESMLGQLAGQLRVEAQHREPAAAMGSP
jgi:hypothetical protein